MGGQGTLVKLHIRLVVLWSHYPEQHGHGTNHYEYTDNSIAKLKTHTDNN
mgnify:CR=1 FL=1